MSFKAEVLADSLNEFGNRITTMLVTFPRIILAEAKTHRMLSGLEEQVEIETSLGFNDDRNLSRNSASSRAIPFNKMLKSVEENPFIPIAWQKDHRGMQGTDYFTAECDINVLRDEWLRGRDEAVKSAKILGNVGLTKQLCNRKLETYMWHTVIVTATEWENFFALRCPRYVYSQNGSEEFCRSKKDLIQEFSGFKNVQAAIKNRTPLEWLQANKGQAEIHMMEIAEMMWDAYKESTPQQLKAGQWHIPYLKVLEKDMNRVFDDLNQTKYFNEFYSNPTMSLVKLSTFMHARTSYTVVGEDLKPLTYKRMIQIHDEMVNANPKHMSPFEHCAQAYDPTGGVDDITYHGHKGKFGNFQGWIQYRKMIKGENITK